MRMKPKHSRRTLPLIESLESRQLLSVAPSVQLTVSNASPVIGRTDTFAALVTSNSGPIPTGTVRFKDGSTFIGKGTLNSSGVATFSEYNILYLGTHSITATYTGDSNYSQVVSSAQSVAVSKGTVVVGSGNDGVQIETLGAGTGPAAVNGDPLSVQYAGFVAATGINFQTGAFPVADLGTGAIDGFSEGLLGIKLGQTRVIFIPAAEGYGASPPMGSGIPANARLVFIVQLSAPITELTVVGSNSTDITNGEAPNSTDGTLFENVSVGSSSGPISIELQDNNASTDGLAFTKSNPIVVRGDDASDFAVSAFNSGSFTITFEPTATGLRTAKIKIFTTDPSNPTYIVNVEGTGL